MPIKLKANKTLSALAALALLLAGCKPEAPKENLVLPVIGERTAPKTEGGDSLYHTIQPFALTNQYKEPVTEKTTEGKIYVADFFFATCQSICPQMSTQLVRVQEAFKNDPNFLILSHSVNPMHDTTEVLLDYGKGYGAIKDKWHFLTGDKKYIYALAKDSYLVNALEDDGSAEGFLHSEVFLLIDTKRRIRGMYDGTNAAEVSKLIEDIKLLKTEIANRK